MADQQFQTKQKTMADQPIPTDVLIEVLIRLPVKSILKSRCVCKTWCDLIRSPIFIHTHQKRERKQRVLLVKRYLPWLPQDGDDKEFPISCLIIPLCDDLDIPSHGHNLFPENGEGEIFSFHDPESPEVSVSPNLSIPILNDLNIPWHGHSDIPIHGPCNGLVCIAFGKTVFLCNPALREFKLLPPPRFPVDYDAIRLRHGFGFDPNTGAYKVIQISNMTHVKGKRIDLYNSASNSWKQVDTQVPNIDYLSYHELFYNHAIHWLAVMAPTRFLCILCFDVRTEAVRQLDFHVNFSQFERTRLMEFNDSLAMVRIAHWTSKIEIWVMREYGVKESWTELFVFGPYRTVIRPLLFLKNELLVESENGQLATCALQESQFKGFQFYGPPFSVSAVFYEESLVSLNEIISSDSCDE